jgi:hypothetical protein
MSLVRVHNFSISLDGFGTGEGQTRDAHLVTPGIGCTNGCSLLGGGSRAARTCASAEVPP